MDELYDLVIVFIGHHIDIGDLLRNNRNWRDKKTHFSMNRSGSVVFNLLRIFS